jgi:hypothetical protein
MAEFKPPAADAFEAITRRTTQERQRQLLAIQARYDRRLGRLLITLNNGAVVGFPLSVLPGLEAASPADLRRIDVENGGYGLHVPGLDADISVPHLLADQLGSTLMKRAAMRRHASRQNGKLGGRPRKSPAAARRALRARSAHHADSRIFPNPSTSAVIPVGTRHVASYS